MQVPGGAGAEHCRHRVRAPSGAASSGSASKAKILPNSSAVQHRGTTLRSHEGKWRSPGGKLDFTVNGVNCAHTVGRRGLVATACNCECYWCTAGYHKMCRDCMQTDVRATASATVTVSLITRTGSAGLCALGVITAFMMTAPSALADPAVSTPPPSPVPDTPTQAVSGDPAQNRSPRSGCIPARSSCETALTTRGRPLTLTAPPGCAIWPTADKLSSQVSPKRWWPIDSPRERG